MMLLSTGLAIISGLALSSRALAQVLESDIEVRDVGNATLDKRSADCDFAKWQWADVNCYYDFGKLVYSLRSRSFKLLTITWQTREAIS